jgi:hypothetical protein
MQLLEVVSPLGLEAAQRKAAAPRIADLDGKTIGEIWNGVFKGDVTFPLIRKRLLDRYPTLRIIPYTEFPHVPGADNPAAQRERARQIAALVQEKHCDAVIAGNGA